MTDVFQEWCGKTLVHEWFTVDDARTAILLCPTVMGVTDLERGFATDLNAKGHSVLIADLYGARFLPEQRRAAFEAMELHRSNRAALRHLLTAVLDTFRPLAGDTPIVPIGFCFGGQCVLDLARSGADVRGVASFHGLFDSPGLPPERIAAKVLAMHGWDDPMVPPDAVAALARELTDGGADWQIHAYGNTGHGFTNPNAGRMGIAGVAFDEAAARRSWASLELFLAELFA